MNRVKERKVRPRTGKAVRKDLKHIEKEIKKIERKKDES